VIKQKEEDSMLKKNRGKLANFINQNIQDMSSTNQKANK
jgi:hypothetical protein